MLFHLDEWQSTGTKIWYCEHTSSYPQGVQKWVIPARVLNMSVDDFLRMLIKDFKPDVITVKKDGSFVSWGWKSLTAMRKYKNWMNAQSRAVNFQI